MKIFFKVLILSIFTTTGFAQSVTLEPGKSVFNQNTTESVEIKSSSAFPLTLRSTQPASGLPFYSNTNMFRGHVQGGVGGMIYSTPANHGHSFWTKNQQRMIIDSVGNVGIAVQSPRYALQIDATNSSDTVVHLSGNTFYTSMVFTDVARIRTSKISFQGFVNQGIGINSNGFIDLTSKGELRISKDLNNGVTETILTASAENGVSINNTIRSSELDFNQSSSTERRPVFADKDGILRIENSSNHYSSYNFSSVQAQDYDDQLRKGSGYAWFNTTNVGATMYLPINLPDGVRITNVRMFLLDNSASNLSFTLNKNSHATNTFTNIASAQSSTNSVSVINITDNANETVDNQNNSYYVNISSSGNWTGNTLQFHSLVITYQYQ
ncbi:MAG TPA: hypothetical protein VK175_18215 [Leadbetterella sp.]|nr:hypothetical protein [Leadbetterella sp.]